MQTVSWLYVMYYEVGKVNVEFLNERLSVYELDPTGMISLHHKTVQWLRTYLQHNLDVRKSHDRSIQEECERWLYNQCRSRVPADDRQWKNCLIGLLKEAHSFLTLLRTCIRSIEQDESRDTILQIWNFRRTRYHAPYEFDKLISLVAIDMGRENIDVDRLCKRFYHQWMKELEQLEGRYNFEVEARKMIEHALLTGMMQVLPFTGKDIMNEFNIAPGPQVGEMLQRARIYFDAGVHSRNELFRKLREDSGITNVGN
jgi:hypothetical protein